MSGIRRPRTAGPGLQHRLVDDGYFDCASDLPIATNSGNAAAPAAAARLPRRPGSQMSMRGLKSTDDCCWPQYVPIRRVPSAMKRTIKIQTESQPRPATPARAAGTTEQQPQQQQDHAQFPSGAAVFYPYYVPGGTQGPAGTTSQQQPFVLLSPWQLPGYQNLPVLDPAQLRLLDPVLQQRQAGQPHPLDGAPIYRSGRNGSCWRHIRQCTGNLGNNIMYLDGNVKEEDCRRYPPHGYPSASTGGLSVFNRLAPKAQPRLAAGLPLGSASRQQQQQQQQRQSLAMERAKSGNKYWFEDKQPAPLVPNTIQGRIMKSGSAY